MANPRPHDKADATPSQVTSQLKNQVPGPATSQPTAVPLPAPADAPEAPATPDLTPLQATLILAQRGNPACLPLLRQALEERPELVAHYGQLASVVDRTWIGLIAGQDLLVTEALTRQLAALRQELAPRTRLEALLVERIVASWLEIQHADMALASSQDEGLRLRQFRLKQLESGSRRFHAACRNLALVRRLLGGVELHVTHEHKVSVPVPTVGASPALGDGVLPSIPEVRRDALFGGVPDAAAEIAGA